MTDSRIKDRLDRHGELKGIRAIEEPHWREIAMLMRPDDRDFDAHVQRRRDDTAIFDSTQLYALDDFCAAIFTQLTNPANRWCELTIADQDLLKYQPVAQWLYRHSSKMLATFSETVSPFYTEVMPWLANTGAFGLGTLYNEEIPGQVRIVDRSIPLGETFRDIDDLGFTTTVHREFSLTARQAERKFKRDFKDFGNKDRTRIVFVHAVYPNEDYRPGALGRRGAQYLSEYVSSDVQDFIRDGFYYDMPYQSAEWNRRSGRAYPTGPGHRARADTAMLQDMERSHIVAAQFAAEPPLLVHDKSMVTAADIEPNAVLYGTMNEQLGKRTIDTLQRSQDLKLSLEMSEQRRNAIRNAFYSSIMMLVNRPEMTATEFLGWNKELLKRMAGSLVNIQWALSAVVARRWGILRRAGQIEPPPPEMAGQAITVKYRSPLATLNEVSDAQGTAQFLQVLEPIAQVSPEVLDNIDMDRAVAILRAGFVSDPSLIKDPAVVAKLRAARAQQIQQQAQLEAAEKAANIGATVSHAQQAATLAKKRVAA